MVLISNDRADVGRGSLNSNTCLKGTRISSALISLPVPSVVVLGVLEATE